MHYVNAPDTGLCQCVLCYLHGTTFLANFRSKPPENRRNPPFPFSKYSSRAYKASYVVQLFLIVILKQ